MAERTSGAPLAFESPVVTAPPEPTKAALRLADASAVTKLVVRSDQPQFDVGFGASVEVDDALVCGSRPGEWLILGSAAACAAAAEQVDRSGFTSIIDLTHGRALFRITGDDAPRALEKVCSLDWSDTMTPDGAVTSASVARVSCDVLRHDVAEAAHGTGVGPDRGEPAARRRSYLIACDRSFGQYLFDALADAADEFR